MKISLCQINPTVGAIDKNMDLIMKWYQKAVAAGAELTVFPELALVGYPPVSYTHLTLPTKRIV